MSDESAVNGVAANLDVEIAANENEYDESTNQTVQKLMQKLQILEQQKQQLVTDNESSAAKIKQLEDVIQISESDKRALSSIAGRAAELETEVSRLQHDLITSMSEGQESVTELNELKRVVEELKKSESEKTEKIDAIEKERNLLLERLSEVEEKLKESDSQIRGFETKIEGFEMREIDLKREKVKVEEKAKVKINEKEEQLQNLNRKVEELQSVIAKNQVDIETSKKEKEELQTAKNDLNAMVSDLESRINQLQKELEAHKKVNAVIKEKEAENTNGIAVNGDAKVANSKVDWPVIAATMGAVALVAVVYFRHAEF